MADDKRHVLVCLNVDCKARGSPKLLEEFQRQVQESGASDVEVKEYICFGGCDFGPNVVVYPAKAFYSGVTPQDVPDILGHVQGGPRVDRLTGQVDDMTEELIFELLDAGLV